MDNKRSKEETIGYFKMLAHEFEKQARRDNDNPVLYAQAEAYELAAFELEHNME